MQIYTLQPTFNKRTPNVSQRQLIKTFWFFFELKLGKCCCIFKMHKPIIPGDYRVDSYLKRIHSLSYMAHWIWTDMRKPTNQQTSTVLSGNDSHILWVCSSEVILASKRVFCHHTSLERGTYWSWSCWDMEISLLILYLPHGSICSF